ncbi:MAG: hypothetical protein JWQ85_2708 [Mucilaginibacter sp.]|nr:hypothetical protein [Mucilaginibacter sp.]
MPQGYEIWAGKNSIIFIENNMVYQRNIIALVAGLIYRCLGAYFYLYYILEGAKQDHTSRI